MIAVHVGAGYHSQQKMAYYRRVCDVACRRAVALLENPDHTAVDAVCVAVSALENDPITNTGFGSNLTLCGTVECDASIMDGRSLRFGAVGALPQVANPVLVAKSICDAQREGSLSLGRIPPCFLVGEGALRWSLSNMPSGVATWKESLVSKEARRIHLEHIKKLERLQQTVNCAYKVERLSDVSNHCPNAESAAMSRSGEYHGTDLATSSGVCNSGTSIPTAAFNRAKTGPALGGAPLSTLGPDEKLDTVGAVCLDRHGNVAAAVSSGGIWLKHSGRVGQAGVYGCGCWAENCPNGVGVAVSTSGGGERLTKTMLARICADALKTAESAAVSLHNCLKTGFVESPFLADVEEKLGGVLALKTNPEEESCDLLWAHTTRTLCYGYMQTGGTAFKFGCSRLQEGLPVGKAVVAGGTVFKLRPPFERDCQQKST